MGAGRNRALVQYLFKFSFRPQVESLSSEVEIELSPNTCSNQNFDLNSLQVEIELWPNTCSNSSFDLRSTSGSDPIRVQIQLSTTGRNSAASAPSIHLLAKLIVQNVFRFKDVCRSRALAKYFCNASCRPRVESDSPKVETNI